MDEIPEDIDNEGMVEGVDMNPNSARNKVSDIVICNNLRAFTSDVDLDTVHVYEFPEYLDIATTHLLWGESEAEELFVGP